MIGGKDGFNVSAFNLGARFAKIGALAARPAFELQFAQMQDSLLGRLDKEIAAIQGEDGNTSATALLDTQLSSLKRAQPDLESFRDRTKQNRLHIDEIISDITTLLTLSTPGTVSEFDTQLAALQKSIDGLNTPVYERFGADDGLRKTKADATSQIAAINHNNFATQGDIDTVNATLSSLFTDFSASKSIVDLNEDSSVKLADANSARILDIETQVEATQIERQQARIDKVDAKREQFTNLLTIISVAFEGSTQIGTFLRENTLEPRKPPPGSVLTLFA